MDDDDWGDDDFLAAVDQLVAQHRDTKSHRLTQPESPNGRPTGPRPLPNHVQQPYQAGPGFPGALLHPPPPPPPPPPPQQQQQRVAAFPASAAPAVPSHGLQAGVSAGMANGTAAGFPVGRVSQAAAELRAQPAPGPAAQGPAPADLQSLLAQLQQERDRLQQQLGSAEGTNKLLRSNLDQAERERHSLRQRVQQLEVKVPAAGGAGAGGPGGGQVSFTALEMQKQLEALKQKLMFKEQEVEELKRQQGDKMERLREAEAAVESLQAQVQRSVLERGQQHAAPPSVAEAQRSSMRQPTSQQQHLQQQQQQQPGRASGQKRRQGAAAENSTAAPQGTPALSAPPQLPAAQVPMPIPLLGAAARAALLPATTGGGLVSRLWAVCGRSLCALLGAAPPQAAPNSELDAMSGAGAAVLRSFAHGQAGAPAPTALLLRAQHARSFSAAGAAGEPAASSFQAGFGLQLQQVAAGALPACTLLDSIAALACSLVADGCKPAGSGGTPVGRSSGQLSGARPGELGPQQAQLLADGLCVVQHLIEHDAGCRQAAAASCSESAGSGRGALPTGPGARGGAAAEQQGPAVVLARLQLSHRVRLSLGASGAQPEQRGAEAFSTVCAACTGPDPCAAPAALPLALPRFQQVLQKHGALFAGRGQGIAGVLIAACVSAGQQNQRVLGAALGALGALAAAMPAGAGSSGSGREALRPVLETGAMERLLRPPALRAQALQLLHLLLEAPALAQALEQGLAQAQAGGGAQHGETPGGGTGGGPAAPADAPGGTAAGGLPRDRSGSKDTAGPSGPSGQEEAAEPMQVDGAGAPPESQAPWAGAPALLRLLLRSLSLPPAAPSQPAAQRSGHGPTAAHRPHHPHNSHHHVNQQGQQQQGAASGEQSGASAPGWAAAAGGSTAASAAQLVSAPRQALKLLAMLWERQAYGILSHLLQSPGEAASGAAGGEGLCQRLVQLLDAALAQQGADTAAAPLLPAQYPSLPAELGALPGSSHAAPAPCAGSVPPPAAASAAQLEWQQRLRLAQEALTLLRGLVTDPALGNHAMEELACSSSSARLPLAALLRLMRLEPPPPPQQPAGVPPLPLAPWAHAIGSSSGAQGALINPGSGRGGLACCSVEDVTYMARSMQHRVLHRLRHNAHKGGDGD